MGKIKEGWKKFRSTKHYRNVMIYLGFVAVSAIFWMIITLNDNAQDDFEVRLFIDDVPQNVTFISDVPQYIHVNVRDKGSTLFRAGILHKPELHLKFNQYAHNGQFKVTNADLATALRPVFGHQATLSVSSEPLDLLYTTAPGKKVKLIIDADISPSFQSVINAKPYATTGNTVTVYAIPSVLDTITSVRTQRIVKHDLKESQEFEVQLMPIKGARVVPEKVKVVIAVEPLVLKSALVEVKPVNVPTNKSVLLFPSKVEVTYFAPMSQFDTASEDIVVLADYNNLLPTSNYIPLTLDSYPNKYINTKLTVDSVECSVVSLQK